MLVLKVAGLSSFQLQIHCTVVYVIVAPRLLLVSEYANTFEGETLQRNSLSQEIIRRRQVDSSIDEQGWSLGRYYIQAHHIHPGIIAIFA